MSWIAKTLTTAFALVLGAWLLPGVHIGDDLWTVLGVSIVVGLFNSVVKPLFIILTIPVTLVTLGLFLIAINAIMLLMVDGLMDGFTIESFWWALLLSGIVSIVRSIVEKTEKKGERT